MPFTLKIDVTKVEAKLNTARKDVELKIKDELNKFGQDAVAEAKRLSPIDEGFLRGKIGYEPPTVQALRTSIVVACNYAAYVEFGTRRFAAAYVASLPATWQAYAATFKGGTGGSMDDFIKHITEWVLRKGIAGTKTKSGKTSKSQDSLRAMRQAAYGIALHILRNGIKAQPYLYPAVTHQLNELKKRLNA